jgi:hypothetical protein
MCLKARLYQIKYEDEFEEKSLLYLPGLTGKFEDPASLSVSEWKTARKLMLSTVSVCRSRWTHLRVLC